MEAEKHLVIGGQMDSVMTEGESDSVITHNRQEINSNEMRLSSGVVSQAGLCSRIKLLLKHNTDLRSVMGFTLIDMHRIWVR